MFFIAQAGYAFYLKLLRIPNQIVILVCFNNFAIKIT